MAICRSKVRFDDREMAEKVARRMRQRHDGQAIGAYRCRICSGWHTGHTDQKKGRTKR